MMKSTGIVRKTDALGRIVIPVELRRTLGIEIKDLIEIYVDGDMVVLKKYEPTCVFCSSSTDVIEYKEKNVCRNCAEKLAHQLYQFSRPIKL